MYNYSVYYDYLWIAFYAVSVFTPFFILGGIRRHGHLSKAGIVAGFFLAATLCFSGLQILTFIFALAGSLTGALLKFDKKKFRLAVLIGFIVALHDVLWPSRLIFLSPLTVNNPTFLNFILGFFQTGEPSNNWTKSFNGYAVSKGSSGLFGTNSIVTGYPEHVGLRVEIKIVIAIALFFILFLAIRGIMKLLKRDNPRAALLSSAGIMGFTLLPFDIAVLVTFICAIFIGRSAFKADLVPDFLRLSSLRRLMAILPIFFTVYFLCYAEGVSDSFGSYFHSINWGAICAPTGVFSLMLGMVLFNKF